MSVSILRNITWLGLGSLAVKPLWFIFITLICVRGLGIEEYGVMTAALALMVIINSLIGLGTSEYSIREIARQRDRAPEFLANFLPFRLLTGLVGLGIGLSIAVVLSGNPDYLWSVFFAGWYVLLQNLTEYSRSFYRSFETLKHEAVSIVIEKVLVVSLGAAFLLHKPTASWVLVGMALGMALTLVANVGWIHRKLVALHLPHLNVKFLREALPQALPLGIAGIFVALYYHIDSVMLAAVSGETPAGQYGLAFRFLEALILLPNIVVAAILPRLSQMFHQQDGESFRRLADGSMGLLFAAGLGISVVIAILAEPILGFITSDPEAAPSVSALQLLIWTFPFAAANYVLSTALIAADDQIALVWILACSAVANVLLNAALIPMYSLMGASFATVVTEVLVCLSLALRYRSQGRSPVSELPA